MSTRNRANRAATTFGFAAALASENEYCRAQQERAENEKSAYAKPKRRRPLAPQNMLDAAGIAMNDAPGGCEITADNGAYRRSDQRDTRQPHQGLNQELADTSRRHRTISTVVFSHGA
jgi:hypothetical protein